MQTSVTVFVSVNKHLARSQQDRKMPGNGPERAPWSTAWSQPAVNHQSNYFRGILRMLMTRKIVVLSLALLVFSVSATLAGPLVRRDKGASNNGVADPFTACSNPLNANNCGNFATTSTPGPDGTTITQFVTNTGDFGGDPATPGTVVFFDVFTVPGVVTPGSVLTLNLSPTDNNFGIFACGNGNGQ